MTPKSSKFSEGEKVLCFHGPLIYEAKCLKVQIREKEKTVKYFVHYTGWNKNWDEWVTESRVLKHHDANLARQRDLQRAHEASLKQKKAKKLADKKKELTTGKEKYSNKDKAGDRSGEEDSRSSTPSTERSFPGGKRSNSSFAAEASADGDDKDTSKDDSEAKKKKIKLESTVETEDQFLGHVEVRIKLPDELKPCLVDDWDFVNRQHKLTTLPARVPVTTILADYTRAKTSAKGNTPNKESAIVEVVAGLQEYFNVALGKQLLYKFERPQYAEIVRTQEDPAKPMAEVYGFIHLLRLFVKMGEMLAYTQLEEATIILLNYHIQDILKFLVKNSMNYFSVNEYGVAPAEYQRTAM